MKSIRVFSAIMSLGSDRAPIQVAEERLFAQGVVGHLTSRLAALYFFAFF